MQVKHIFLIIFTIIGFYQWARYFYIKEKENDLQKAYGYYLRAVLLYGSLIPIAILL